MCCMYAERTIKANEAIIGGVVYKARAEWHTVLETHSSTLLSSLVDRFIWRASTVGLLLDMAECVL